MTTPVDSMIIPAIAIFTGVVTARILESLFEVRWKQAQDIIRNWMEQAP